MSGKTYGYVRVSTKGQKEDRQLIAMREFGVPAEHIVVEKQSGRILSAPPISGWWRRCKAGTFW